MSFHKEVKATVLRQKNGLVNSGYQQNGDASSIGLVGQYNYGTTPTYAGLFRNSTDKNFYLFDSLTTSPFTTDTVSATGPGFNRAGFLLGALDSSKGVNVSGGNLTVAVGNATVTQGNFSVPNGSATVGNLVVSANTITSTQGNIVLQPAAGGSVLLAADPTSTLGAATKQYVDSVATGLDAKNACRVITVQALASLSGGGVVAAGSQSGKTLTRAISSTIAQDAAAFDGITLATGDRVLVANEGLAGVGSASNNGIYVVTDGGGRTTPWVLTRSIDAATNAQVTSGLFTFIEEGAVYGDTGWVLGTPGPITVDTSPLNFVQFSSAGLTSAANVGGGVPLYTGKSGNNLQFRSLLAANGTNASQLIELQQDANDVLFRIDQTQITTTGVVTAGSIANGFGTISTSSPITTTNTATASTVQTTGGLVALNGSTLSFAGTTSGSSVLQIPIAQAVGLNITDGTSSYVTIDTANGAQAVQFPQGSVAFSGTSGNSILNLGSNLIDALSFKEGALNFLKFTTTTGSESITSAQKLITTQGTVSFMASSGNNTLAVTPSIADALNVTDGSNTYLRVVTTSGAQKVVLPQGTLAFSGTAGNSQVLLGGNLTDALTFTDGTNAYLRYVTSTGGQKVSTQQVLEIAQGTVSFAASNTNNLINIPSNQNTALNIQDKSGNSLALFDTTTNAERVIFAQNVELGNGTLKFKNSASGANNITMLPSQANALTVQDNTGAYLSFNTTAGSQSIIQSKQVINTAGKLYMNSTSNYLQFNAGLANALTVGDGTNSYVNYVSTVGSESVNFIKPTNLTTSLTVNSGDTYLNTGFKQNVTVITSSTTLGNTVYFVVANATSGAITVTLPSASANQGRSYRIVKQDASANNVTIQVGSGDNLDGVINDNLVLTTQYDHAEIACSGSDGWFLF